MAARFLAIVVAVVFFLAPANAQLIGEKYCSVAGSNSAVRQTVFVIDEAHVAPSVSGQMAQSNSEWASLLVSVLKLDNPEQNTFFLPRERVTILFARKDGAEPAFVFTGCLPFFSASELAAMPKDAVGEFFRGGRKRELQKESEKFKAQLGAALVRASEPGLLSKSATPGSTFAGSGLLSSLRRSSLANLSRGIPRIILYSDLSRFSDTAKGDVPTIRMAGDTLGKTLPIAFARAELYVVGTPPSPKADKTKEFMSAYFLRSGAWLQGWSHRNINQMDSHPDRVEIYSGFVDLMGREAPVQLRLAYSTTTGRVVNSWFATQLDVEVATPFTADIVVQKEGKRVRNDGRVFAQVWSFNPDEKPEFDPSLPFAGMRVIDFRVVGSVAEGRISDPLVILDRSDKQYLEFRLNKLEKGAF